MLKGEKVAKSLKGTRTEKNLLTAFAGESQARNRYAFFASAARKEGFEQIANIFTETAENEKEHAKVFFKYLEGGDTEITATYPAGMIKDAKSNLDAAALARTWNGRLFTLISPKSPMMKAFSTWRALLSKSLKWRGSTNQGTVSSPQMLLPERSSRGKLL